MSFEEPGNRGTLIFANHTPIETGGFRANSGNPLQTAEVLREFYYFIFQFESREIRHSDVEPSIERHRKERVDARKKKPVHAFT